MLTALDTREIQGNVLIGFNKDHQTFLFVRLPARKRDAKQWLASVVPSVATHEQVALYKQLYQIAPASSSLSVVWMNIALTPSGLDRLGHPEDVCDSDAFREGLARRAPQLGDVRYGALRRWLPAFREPGAIDAVFIVAGDRVEEMRAAVASFGAALEMFGGNVALALEGAARVDEPGHEHFGFKDGVSQPGVRGVTPPNASDPRQGQPGQDLIEPGEFVLGYARQPRDVGPDVAIASPDWTKNGSFFVFQRLLQDVPGFRSALAAAARTHGLSPDLLGAKFVGRHKSGCPLELMNGLGDVGQTTADVGSSNPNVLAFEHINDFEYVGLDHYGKVVPRAAHIRKAYPRNDVPPGEDATQTHRILRRGIAFGASYEPAATSGTASHADSERGLLFACYQSSIEEQFEYVQRAVLDPNFPNPGDGVDPILNDRANAAMTVPGATPETIALTPFVSMTGGAYFYAPSISALTMLAS